MTLHLIKLCVGCDSIADLEGWIAESLRTAKRLGKARERIHVTRMAPKRADEVLDGGSLYWVIKGLIACRHIGLINLKRRVGETQKLAFGLALSRLNYSCHKKLSIRNQSALDFTSPHTLTRHSEIDPDFRHSSGFKISSEPYSLTQISQKLLNFFF